MAMIVNGKGFVGIRRGTVVNIPSIVTDGLKLYLDAGNTSSYPGTGTVWTDISGNGNNGTLNGPGGSGFPSYNSANSGSITFDGTDDYISMNSKPTSTQFSILAWVNIGNINSSYRTIYADNTKGFWLNNRVISYYPILNGISTLNINQWYYITVTYNGTSVISYINGVLDKSVNGTTALPSGASTAIGGHDNIEYFNGKISNIQIYNRALSSTEITQNYNVLKSRFGL